MSLMTGGMRVTEHDGHQIYRKSDGGSRRGSGLLVPVLLTALVAVAALVVTQPGVASAQLVRSSQVVQPVSEAFVKPCVRRVLFTSGPPLDCPGPDFTCSYVLCSGGVSVRVQTQLIHSIEPWITITTVQLNAKNVWGGAAPKLPDGINWSDQHTQNRGLSDYTESSGVFTVHKDGGFSSWANIVLGRSAWTNVGGSTLVTVTVTLSVQEFACGTQLVGLCGGGGG